jgi:hypothetical protein
MEYFSGHDSTTHNLWWVLLLSVLVVHEVTWYIMVLPLSRGYGEKQMR